MKHNGGDMFCQQKKYPFAEAFKMVLFKMQWQVRQRICFDASLGPFPLLWTAYTYEIQKNRIRRERLLFMHTEELWSHFQDQQSSSDPRTTSASGHASLPGKNHWRKWLVYENWLDNKQPYYLCL